MSVGLDYVRSVDQTEASSAEFGLPLTADEEADLAARPGSEDVAPLVAFGASHSDVFGGIYIDQKDRGVVDIAFTSDGARLIPEATRLLGPDVHVRTRIVSWTEAQLSASVSLVTNAIPALEKDGIHVVQVVPDVRSNLVDVYVDQDPAGASSRLATIFGPIVRSIRGQPATPAACSQHSCPPPWRGGLEMNGATQACTSGFLAKSQGSYYLVTAGHCDGDLGNPSFSNGGVYIGSVTRTAFYSGSTADALALRIDPTKRSNWVWVSTTEVNRPITTWACCTVGTLISKQGFNSGRTYGQIAATGVTISYSGITWYDQVQSTEYINGGDSGGPVFYYNTLYGTVTAWSGSHYNSFFTRVDQALSLLSLNACLTAGCN